MRKAIARYTVRDAYTNGLSSESIGNVKAIAKLGGGRLVHSSRQGQSHWTLSSSTKAATSSSTPSYVLATDSLSKKIEYLSLVKKVHETTAGARMPSPFRP